MDVPPDGNRDAADAPPVPAGAPGVRAVLATVPAADPAGDSAPAPRPREARGFKRFRARWLALVGVTGLALYLCWLMLEPFVEVLLWAAVLAMVFYPAHRAIARRTGSAGWGALLSTLVVVAAIVVPVGLVTVAVVVEAQSAAKYLQENADRLLSRETKLVAFVDRYVVDLNRLPAPRLPGDAQGPPAPSTRPAAGLLDYLAEQVRNFSGAIAGGTVAIVGGVLVTLLKVIFVVLTMYYLFRDGDRIKAALLDSLPLERAQSQRIFDRTREVIGASVYGVLVVASLQAVLAQLGFIATGLPSPLLWGVLMFFFSMIPMAGSFLVWVPACLYLAASGHWVKAVLLAAWCAGVVGMVDNVLRPRLVGRRTRLHELLVFFSVLGGLKVFGALGLVIGPVVVAITLALVDVFRKADRGTSWAEPTLAERQAALRNVPPEEAGEGGGLGEAGAGAPAGRVPIEAR